MNPRIRDLTKQTFGILKVLGYAGLSEARRAQWLCVCECGRTSIVRSSNLIQGMTRSCNQCLGHGHLVNGKVTPTYQSWKNMMTRCTCPSHKEYSVYGGAGVMVLSGWIDFKHFLDDLGVRPPNTTLGRILDMGNYEKGNAFWQTREEQRLALKNRHALEKWRIL